ncbi:ribosomal L1 domain-containing protein 1-like [Uloborus diversus]|uniref:ribosomal L1 domain-containing protein 1-like n=1 Tax=Uloborus diversus TaxID=327109 RepID=UPI00240A180C|nr:ribosomal L1 domain-containing protein 1-like [Uloborus diversus]
MPEFSGNSNMDEPIIKKVDILEAVKILKDSVQVSFNVSRKKSLLEDENQQPIFMQVTVKKIPPRKTIKLIKVPLKNSLMKDDTEVCLFAGDLDKKNRKAEVEPDVLHYKNLLKEQNISQITEVITLRQLRTEFKTFEAKRQLMAAYDVFLADSRIAGVLHRFLGKAFYRKRKLPIQINIKTANLKDQVQNALSATVFPFTSHGNSCTSEIAHLQMENKQILHNITAAVRVLAQNIPGKWPNILGIYIKTAKSKAIPIYMSFGSANEVSMQKGHKQELIEAEELSTLPNAKVKVYRDGHIFVQQMNDSDSENESKVKSKQPRQKKRKFTTKNALSKGIKKRKI